VSFEITSADPLSLKQRSFSIAKILEISLLLRDVVVAVAAAPIFLVLSILVALDVRGPILSWSKVSQTKVGDARQLCRFRTLGPAHNESGLIIPDCDRRSIFGKFLFWSMLDRVPQLLARPFYRYTTR
jgi:lipopolysaccharide/colanic/teichoic acid biosynthesis glycosyltransferase